MKVSKDSFTYLLQLIYNSDEAKASHDTKAFDKYSPDTSKKKLDEMIKCNKHKPCKLLTELFK